MVHALKARLFSAALMMFALVSSAHAQLYGLSSGTPGSLYTLNASTGAATFVTDLVGAQQTSLVGLAFLNNTLYASDVFDASSMQFTFGGLDPNTGFYAPLNVQGGSSNWQALASNPASNLLYTVDNDATPGRPLLSVTPTGAISPIGDTGLTEDVGGLAYVNGMLYAVTSDADSLTDPYRLDLYTLDTTTGNATHIGGLGISNSRFDLVYDPVDGALCLNTGSDGNASDNQLYTLNVLSGAATLVGANGVTMGDGIDGLAWRPQPITTVPEPDGYAFCSVFCTLPIAVALLRSRRKQ